MKKIILKSGFFKKPNMTFSEEFIGKCVPSGVGSNSVVAYVYEDDDSITISPKPRKNTDVTLNLEASSAPVLYKEAVGLFSFREDTFYRSKGSAGRSLKEDKSFSDFLKEKYPEEFANMKATEISSVKVIPLTVK